MFHMDIRYSEGIVSDILSPEKLSTSPRHYLPKYKYNDVIREDISGPVVSCQRVLSAIFSGG